MPAIIDLMQTYKILTWNLFLFCKFKGFNNINCTNKYS